jgi:ABC-type Fe3+ transport system permease subunit
MRIGDIIAMVALVVCVLIALIIVGNLQGIAESFNLGEQGNATRTQLFQNTWTGLTLASLGIIIAAAVGILSLVIGALGGASGLT